MRNSIFNSVCGEESTQHFLLHQELEPFNILLRPTLLEESVFLQFFPKTFKKFPRTFDTHSCVCRACLAKRLPIWRWRCQEMQHTGKLGFFQVRFLNLIRVAFIYQYTIGKLNNTLFDTLQFIALNSKLNEQEKVCHRTHSYLTLPYPDCLDQNNIKTCRFA